MVVKLEPEKMSHEELVKAHREHDSTPVKQKLYEKHQYSLEQLSAISRGDYKPDQGDNWSEVKKSL